MPAVDPYSAGSAAQVEHKDRMTDGVGLVFAVRDNVSQAVFTEFLRPMACFTGLPCGTQIPDRNGDRPRIVVQCDGNYLAGAGKLAAHKPGGTRTNVTGHAFNTRMRRALVCGKFRLH